MSFAQIIIDYIENTNSFLYSELADTNRFRIFTTREMNLIKSLSSYGLEGISQNMRLFEDSLKEIEKVKQITLKNEKWLKVYSEFMQKSEKILSELNEIMKNCIQEIMKFMQYFCIKGQQPTDVKNIFQMICKIAEKVEEYFKKRIAKKQMRKKIERTESAEKHNLDKENNKPNSINSQTEVQKIYKNMDNANFSIFRKYLFEKEKCQENYLRMSIKDHKKIDTFQKCEKCQI